MLQIVRSILKWQSAALQILHLPSAGLGFALSYTPAIAMVGTYFSERKALAYGIAMSGSDSFIYLVLYFHS